jgi:hypothetical protein
VVQTIEEEGVQKFVASFDELVARLSAKQAEIAAV